MTEQQAQSAIPGGGTINAIVVAPPRTDNGVLTLALALPKRIELERAAGRFVLARCGAQSELERLQQWSIYLRRPLFLAAARPQPDSAGEHATWQVCAPPRRQDDPGYRWLAQRAAGETLNLTGPYGNGFVLLPPVRRLLLLAEPARLPLLTPLIDEILDRGGQVSLLLVEEQAGLADFTALAAALPFNVELHPLAATDWNQGLVSSLRWADQLCAALGADRLPPLAEAIRQARLRLESGFAFALADADFACGYGSCLACAVPLANGSLTRACIHGPVFDLLELAGKG